MTNHWPNHHFCLEQKNVTTTIDGGILPRLQAQEQSSYTGALKQCVAEIDHIYCAKYAFPKIILYNV